MTEQANAPQNGPEGETPPEDKTDWKAEARKWEARSKAHEKDLEKAKPLAEKYQELQDASKTETEKLQGQLTSLQQMLSAQRDLTVRSRIEALAANDFADPSDAATVLDSHSFLTLEGGVNDAAIKQELANLLQAKPHWRKTDAGSGGGARPPVPNPAQGSGGTPVPVSKGSLFAAALAEAAGRSAD